MKKIILLTLAFFFLFVGQSFAQNITPKKPQISVRIEAVVEKVLEDSLVIEETGNKHPYQKLLLLGTSGTYKGRTFTVENGKYDQNGIVTYKPGDTIALTVEKNFEGKDSFTITDYVRRTPLFWLFGIFITLAVIIGGRRGATSLLGMVVTFGILFLFVLPQVSNGGDPVSITIIASLFIVPITFCLSHGFNSKTLFAIFGTFIALLITGLLSNYFVNAAHLTGFASEEAGFLDIAKHGRIDILGLLLGGIIIGLLGVLQDITISQAAIVFQLKGANEKIEFRELFVRAMDVGRDHIASMANTLILVYAGASLPLLLMFINTSVGFLDIVNYQVIAEEIVRTLIASIGLIIAVPITTALTVIYVEMIKKKTI